MTDYVTIKHAWADRPVYHRSGFVRERPREHWNEGPGIGYSEWVNAWYEKMACGAKMPLTAVFIQRERADLFARPCRRCFADELPSD